MRICAFRLTGLWAAWAVASSPLSVSAQPRDSAGEGEMLRRINALRQAAQLPRLERDSALDAAAFSQSVAMAWEGQLFHVSEDGGDPGERVGAHGYDAAAVAENVASGSTAAAAMQSLIESEHHLASILSASHTHLGLAAVVGNREASDGSEGSETVWVTQVFARPSEDMRVNVPPAAADPTFQERPPGQRVTPVRAPAMVAPTVPAIPTDPTIAVPGRDPNAAAPVIGYWVHQRGTWWYFPLPADAVPGEQLEADLTVAGPPPGFGVAQPGNVLLAPWQQTPAVVSPRRRGIRRGVAPPPFGWSPRRQFRRWRVRRGW